MMNWIFDFMASFRPVMIGALIAYALAAVAIVVVGVARMIKR
jgi:hypothetical protein